MISFSNPGQFFGPKEMLDNYKSLPCKTPGGAASVSINNYRNASHGPTNGGTGDALKIKDSLLQLGHKDATARAGGNEAFVDVFVGKGSPKAIIAVMETFVAYSDNYVKTFGKAGKTPAGQCAAILADAGTTWEQKLQKISDNWLGLDCNGFVGNWLKIARPHLKLNQNSTSKAVLAKATAHRTKIDDITGWDVMCYVNDQHIAAINGEGASDGVFQVCQSAGGGPRMNEYKLLKTGAKTFKLAAPTKQDYAAQFYVVSVL